MFHGFRQNEIKKSFNKFLKVKQKVSHSETKSFSARNKAFRQKTILFPVNYFGVTLIFRRDFRPVAAENFTDCGLVGGGEREFLAKNSVVAGFPKMVYQGMLYVLCALIGNVVQEALYSPCKADFPVRAEMRALFAFLRIKQRIERAD